MKLSELETVMIEHLKESGEIRADIRTLKSQAHQITAGIWTVVGCSFLTLVSMVGFLLKLKVVGVAGPH